MALGIGISICLPSNWMEYGKRLSKSNGEELVNVDGEVVAFLVARQHAAVAVEDRAAGRRHGDVLLADFLVAAGILLAQHDLHVIEVVQVNGQQQRHQDAEGPDSAFGNRNLLSGRGFFLLSELFLKYFETV